MGTEPLAQALAAAAPYRAEGGRDHIPALASADPGKLGIAVADADGRVWGAGDCDEAFSIQSISKVFMLALALEQVGPALWDKVGREPLGTRVQLDRPARARAGPAAQPADQSGRDGGHRPPDREGGAGAAIADLLGLLRAQARDDGIRSTRRSPHRKPRPGAQPQPGLVHEEFRVLANEVETVVGAYFRQCAVAMSCRQLARAGLFLAFDGRDPESGEQVIAWHGRGGSTA